MEPGVVWESKHGFPLWILLRGTKTILVVVASRTDSWVSSCQLAIRENTAGASAECMSPWFPPPFFLAGVMMYTICHTITFLPLFIFIYFLK